MQFRERYPRQRRDILRPGAEKTGPIQFFAECHSPTMRNVRHLMAYCVASFINRFQFCVASLNLGRFPLRPFAGIFLVALSERKTFYNDKVNKKAKNIRTSITRCQIIFASATLFIRFQSAAGSRHRQSAERTTAGVGCTAVPVRRAAQYTTQEPWR